MNSFRCTSLCSLLYSLPSYPSYSHSSLLTLSLSSPAFSSPISLTSISLLLSHSLSLLITHSFTFHCLSSSHLSSFSSSSLYWYPYRARAWLIWQRTESVICSWLWDTLEHSYMLALTASHVGANFARMSILVNGMEFT